MKQPQGPKAIVDGLKAGGLLTNAKHFYANVTTALKRLRAAEQVVLTPNGWGLAEWYPSKPRTDDGRRSNRRKRNRAGAKRRPSGESGTVTAEAQEGSANGAKPMTAYRAFVSEAMKGGKTMAQAAEAWRKQKDGV